MKTFYLVIFVSINLFAQNPPYGDDELFFYQDTGYYTYKLIPLGSAVWDNTGILRYEDEYGRSVFDPLSLSLNGYIGSVTSTNGMDYILSSEENDVPVFGNGIYKVSCLSGTYENSRFYLDIRDCGYPGSYSGGVYNDFTIKYLSTTNKFYIVEGKGVLFNDSRFEEVTNQVAKLWNVEGILLTGVDCFDDFWQNCLVIGAGESFPLQIIWAPNPDQSNISKYYLYREIDGGSFTKIGEFNNQTFDFKDKSILFTGDGSSTVSYKVTSFNGIESTPTNIASQQYYFEFDWSNGLILTKNGNHPKLVWVPNNTIQNLTGYKIYRKVDNQPFYYVGTLGINTYSFTDSEVNLNIKESGIWYYIAATNGTQEDPTNTVFTFGEYNPHKENQPGEESLVLKYFLSDNYPNPFNPNTSISYSIPENAFVTLKIYDVLGNEVEVLISEQKEPGNYQVDFNASELSSGIYYYALTAGNFISTKKMSLIK